MKNDEIDKRLLPANPMIAGLAPGEATTDWIAWVRVSLVFLPLHSPISDAKVLTGRQKPMTEIAFLFAEIESEQGHSGVGFSYSKRAGCPGQFAHAKEIADELIGEDPNDIARVWDKLVWAGASVGRSGLATQTIAVFDNALWDLKAKRAGLPMAKLLGAHRDSVQCYNTSGGFLSMDIEEVKERTSMAIDAGIGGIKIKVGQPDPMIDLQRIEAIRDHIGGNMPMMIDANQQWDRPTAHRFGRIVEQYNLTWIEEPLDAYDAEGHVRLAAELATPVATGEMLTSVAEHYELIRNDSVDFIQPDAPRVGGITQFLKICALAEQVRLRHGAGGARHDPRKHCRIRVPQRHHHVRWRLDGVLYPPDQRRLPRVCGTLHRYSDISKVARGESRQRSVRNSPGTIGSASGSSLNRRAGALRPSPSAKNRRQAVFLPAGVKADLSARGRRTNGIGSCAADRWLAGRS